MSDEYATEIDQHSQFLVSYFERDEGMSRRERIEVSSYSEKLHPL